MQLHDACESMGLTRRHLYSLITATREVPGGAAFGVRVSGPPLLGKTFFIYFYSVAHDLVFINRKKYCSKKKNGCTKSVFILLEVLEKIEASLGKNFCSQMLVRVFGSFSQHFCAHNLVNSNLVKCFTPIHYLTHHQLV